MPNPRWQPIEIRDAEQLVIVVVPTLIVYILLQRQLTQGITTGALKG